MTLAWEKVKDTDEVWRGRAGDFQVCLLDVSWFGKERKTAFAHLRGRLFAERWWTTAQHAGQKEHDTPVFVSVEECKREAEKAFSAFLKKAKLRQL